MNRGTKIAGELTVDDWHSLSSRLIADIENLLLWEKAFEYFLKRMDTRYLRPIRSIEENGKIEGEGFAVVAIVCSMIEALESFYQGKSFREGTQNHPLDERTEYYKSQTIFESFLENREPFKTQFAALNLATEFYKNVRCAILHEAATRGGWIIRTNTATLIEKQGDYLIVNRVLLVEAIVAYLENYKQELFGSCALKGAFIRKFNAICASA